MSLELFFGYIVASGGGVIFAVVFLIIILPGRVVAVPLGVGDLLILRGGLEVVGRLMTLRMLLVVLRMGDGIIRGMRISRKNFLAGYFGSGLALALCWCLPTRIWVHSSIIA